MIISSTNGTLTPFFAQMCQLDPAKVAGPLETAFQVKFWAGGEVTINMQINIGNIKSYFHCKMKKKQTKNHFNDIALSKKQNKTNKKQTLRC